MNAIEMKLTLSLSFASHSLRRVIDEPPPTVTGTGQTTSESGLPGMSSALFGSVGAKSPFLSVCLSSQQARLLPIKTMPNQIIRSDGGSGETNREKSEGREITRQINHTPRQLGYDSDDSVTTTKTDVVAAAGESTGERERD